MDLQKIAFFTMSALAASDQTSMTQFLNAQILSGGGAYNKGKGILVRTPDFFTGGGTTVVPATFWVNDIVAVSQAYPQGNPWCPHGKTDGFEDLSWATCGRDTRNGPWDYATVAAVIAGDAMNLFFKDFDSKTSPNIQSPDWGWGVFYATDANAADKRCKYQDNGWNCPGGWVDANGKFTAGGQKGAGYFTMGNPDAGLGGGGAGCHFDTNQKAMDQVDAWVNGDQSKDNLVKDGNCQCNYNFNKNWNAWVDDWIADNQQKPGFESRDWLGKHGKKAPSWAIDTTICWVNNPRDMIKMQNAIYNARDRWNNKMAPLPESGSSRRYWGWNEVPVTRNSADDAKNWAAVMIKLPAQLCGGRQDHLGCLGTHEQQTLEQDLQTFVSKGRLIPGSANVRKNPGSYVVIAREYDVGGGRYERQFYCEKWASPSHVYTIEFYEQTDPKTQPGSCYVENYKASVVV